MYRLVNRKWCTLPEAREQPLDCTIDACLILDAVEDAERRASEKASK